MRISDWSSDVCSSDLVGALPELRLRLHVHLIVPAEESEIVDVERPERALHRFVDGVHRHLERPRLLPIHQHPVARNLGHQRRSEEHTSELQSLMRISYAVFCLKQKRIITSTNISSHTYN